MKQAGRLLFLIFIYMYPIMTMKGQAIKVQAGTVVTVAKFPARNVLPRRIDIWLPEKYDSTLKYNVLYMNDGQMLFDSTLSWNKQEWRVDETMSELISEKKIRKCIVVGIWNMNQTHTTDYLPAKPLRMLDLTMYKMLVDSEFGGNVMGDNYLKFLVTELKPYIDSHFSTYRDAEHTFIAGSSKGALSALYAICEYPGTFGAAACLSTHWQGTTKYKYREIPSYIIRYLEDNLPSPANHRIYFDYGDEPLDSLYADHQARVDELMKQRGFSVHENWTTLKFKGDADFESAWGRRFGGAIQFIMKKDKE